MVPRTVDDGNRAVSISRYGFLLGLVLLLGGVGCAPKPIVSTTPSGYRIEVFPPIAIIVRQSGDLVVRVQDAQGQPVDGVPVTFQVAPSLRDNASVAPDRTTTRAGEARTVFRAAITGRIPVTIMVDTTQLDIIITVGRPPERGAA